MTYRVLGKGATLSVFSVTLKGSSREENCVIKNVNCKKRSALENEIAMYDVSKQHAISSVPILIG